MPGRAGEEIEERARGLGVRGLKMQVRDEKDHEWRFRQIEERRHWAGVGSGQGAWRSDHFGFGDDDGFDWNVGVVTATTRLD